MMKKYWFFFIIPVLFILGPVKTDALSVGVYDDTGQQIARTEDISANHNRLLFCNANPNVITVNFYFYNEYTFYTNYEYEINISYQLLKRNNTVNDLRNPSFGFGGKYWPSLTINSYSYGQFVQTDICGPATTYSETVSYNGSFVANGQGSRGILSWNFLNKGAYVGIIVDRVEITNLSDGSGAIINNSTSQIIQNQNTNQQQTNEKLDKIDETLTDDDISDAENDANEFFSNFESDDFGLSDIITLPLTFIQGLSSATCYNLELPLPFVDTNVTLPCMTSIYQTYFGNFLTLYQIITTGFIAYWVCINIFRLVQGFKNPDNSEIEVMEL